MKKIINSILLLGLVSTLGTAAIVYAATNHNPNIKGEGNKISAIVPTFKEEGESIGVVTPSEIIKEDDSKDESDENEPYVPFVPEIKDSDPFIDMDNPRDFSTQYDYLNYSLVKKNGNYSEENGEYVSNSEAVLIVNSGNETPFPYGTYSADICNNAYDAGIVFGLSSDKTLYWEGNGISYYFAFISWDGTAYLGKTDNGNWYALEYKPIPGFDKDTSYELKVLYRVDRIILMINNEIYINYAEVSPLSGTHWGIRMGGTGATISAINISSKVTMD